MLMQAKVLAAFVVIAWGTNASGVTIFTENFETTSAGGPGIQGASKALSSLGTPNEFRFGELNNGGLADPTRNFTLTGWTIESGATISATGTGAKAYVQRDNDGGTTANTSGNGALAGMPNDANGDLWLLLDRRGANATTGFPVGAYASPTVIAGDTAYTLSVTAGKRGDLGLPPEFQFGLWSGAGANPDTPITGAVLNETAFNNPVPSGGGTSQSYNIVLDTSLPGNAGLVGQNLFIRFLIPGSAGDASALQVAFDNVSLDAVPVPEPTTLMMAFGLASALLPRRSARRTV